MRKQLLLSTALLGLALAPMSANAAGFYIQEQSVSGLGSAFSGSVTNLNDASTVYFNPAGMTKLNGNQAQLGAHLIVPSADLENTGSTTVGGGAIVGQDGGNPYDPTPVPNGFATYKINDQLWAGIGISAPFGLANEYDDDFFGRFDSLKTELLTIDIQPSLAYKVNDRLSVGGGINIQYADAELTNAASVNGTTEGLATLEGDDWSVGYTLGLQYHITDRTMFGASYRSAVKHELEGRVSTVGTGTADFSVDGRADLDLPDIATFGLSHQYNDKLKLHGQATWFGWNNFESIATTADQGFSILGGGVTVAAGETFSTITQNYQTTWAFAVGGEYEYSDDWTFRGGVQFDETPTTDEYRTTRTPDGDRTWIAGGATYNMNQNWNLDMAATYIFIDDQEVNVTRNNTFSAATATSVKADTEGSVAIFAVAATYKF